MNRQLIEIVKFFLEEKQIQYIVEGPFIDLVSYDIQAQAPWFEVHNRIIMGKLFYEVFEDEPKRVVFEASDPECFEQMSEWLPKLDKLYERNL